MRVSEEVGMRYLRELEEKNYEREEGRQEGRELNLMTLIRKKIQKAKPLEVIAEELEEDSDSIKDIYEMIKRNPDKSEEDIYEMLEEKNGE